MSSLSGTGTRFYGHSKVDMSDKSCYATRWVSFFYLPIIPLSRYKISFSHPEYGFSHSSQYYRILEQTPKVSKEILQTLFWSWLVMPLVLGAPLLLFAVFFNDANPGYFFGCIAWLIVLLWMLADWYDERGIEPKKRWLSKLVK